MIDSSTPARPPMQTCEQGLLHDLFATDRRSSDVRLEQSVDTDLTMTALQSALRGLAQRQRVTADNVANIETPNFTASQVDFESTLRAAIQQAAVTGKPSVAAVTPTDAPTTDPARQDGNNVNLDSETVTDLDTQLRYQLMLRAVGDQFSLLRDSMRSV